MISSMFIVSAESKDVLIEKHWGSITDKSVVSFFWEEVAKVRNISEVPSVLTSPQHYIFHYVRDGVLLLCCSQEEMPPLLAIEFMVRCAEIFVEYFGDCRERTLRAYFVTVYQLLEEMCDSGMPLVTETSILKEIIVPPSLMNRMTSAVQGTKGVVVNNQLPDGITSNIPWRRAGVKYASNEIFFDMVEEIDATIDSQGRVVTTGVVGQINCNCRLSGMPDVTLTFNNPHVLDDARLHPSVRFARFAGDKALSFVPPDGEFTLMHYRMKTGGPSLMSKGGIMGRMHKPASVSMPLYVKPQVNYHNGVGRVNIMCGPKSDLGKPCEAISITLPLPHNVTHCDLNANWGMVNVDLVRRFARWDIGKLPKDKTPILAGTLRLDITNVEGGPSSVMNKLQPASILSVDFRVLGVTVSGLSVDSLSISNESYRPYKGVRSLTKAGLFEVRT